MTIKKAREILAINKGTIMDAIEVANIQENMIRFKLTGFIDWLMVGKPAF